MSYDPEHHNRRSIRIPDFDYSAPGWFYITICTYQREPLFSLVENGLVNVTAFGHLTELCWQAIPSHFNGVDVDAFVVMPNHLHGIIVIDDHQGTACHAPTTEAFGRPVGASLATIIRPFKSAASKEINEVRETPGAPVWQRGFYERVIRSERELIRFRAYIEDNPSRWASDPENKPW
jgi:REP element-mobilizing transposase RayT